MRTAVGTTVGTSIWCGRCVLIAIVKSTYISRNSKMCSRCLPRAAFFFSSIYVRASSVGTCSASTLQHCLLFQNVYVRTPALQEYVPGSTCCTEVGIIVRARAVGTAVGTVGT